MLLHMNGKFTMGKLKSSLLSKNFVINRLSLSISRCRSTVVIIGMDCIGSCKSNQHTIRTTTTSITKRKWELMDLIGFLYLAIGQKRKLQPNMVIMWCCRFYFFHYAQHSLYMKHSLGICEMKKICGVQDLTHIICTELTRHFDMQFLRFLKFHPVSKKNCP